MKPVLGEDFHNMCITHKVPSEYMNFYKSIKKRHTPNFFKWAKHKQYFIKENIQMDKYAYKKMLK